MQKTQNEINVKSAIFDVSQKSRKKLAIKAK
jgi:hypothetical protein